MSGAGGGKRPSGGDSPPVPPEKKTKKEEKTTTTLIEPIRIAGVSSTEEMDMKVLQFKNKKLCERLEQRQTMEDELREKIEKLEKRQATDDTTLLIVNRYWSQLDENVQVLRKRIEPGTPVSSTPAPPAPPLPGPTPMEEDGVSLASQTSAVPPPPLPASPNGGELAEKQDAHQEERLEGQKQPPPPTGSEEMNLKEPPHDSSTDASSPPPPLSDNAKGFLVTLEHSSEEELSLHLQDRMQFSKEAIACLVCVFDRLHSRIDSMCKQVQAAACDDDSQSDIINENHTLLDENTRLRDLTTLLQGRHHKMSMEYNELVDKVTSSETKVSEMETTVEDLQWDIEKLRTREQKLNKHLAEAMEQLKSGYSTSSSGGISGGQITLNIQKFESLNAELEHNAELANSRMAELEKLQAELQEAVRESEKLKMDLRNIPEDVVKETVEYKCLQSQFSLLYNESLGVKTQLDEARALLLTAKNAHLRQIEHMESDELSLQKKLRTEVIQLEDTLAQVRKEYEMLRIEFEQNLAANEQAGPINREMRHLISSLQNHNLQLKGDVQRYKRKLRETQMEINKLRCQSGDTGTLILDETTNDSIEVKKEDDEDHEEEEERRKELERQRAREREREREADRERDRERERQRSDELKRKDSDTLKMLRVELKKAQESQKEMKLLLDMYKSAPKEQRDKVQLMAAERKSKAEVDELRMRVRELEERERKESKKLADEDALRKIRVAEETIEHLQKKLAATKQEEALLSEMDVTGQAFEDMQEQNSRLLQQLREKDDANFKLMSERIKSNQIYKLLKEEKEELADQVLTFKTQVDAQLLVVQKLEEKEGVLQSTLAALEKELTVRTQGLELNKRKAVEAAQLAEDLKVQLEHTQAKLKEIQVSVAENRTARERESSNLKRAQEDLSRLRRKLEKQKKVEVYSDADEILQEEINQYKAKLRCPCCNTRDKETVLTKCFHVFCYECLKMRYDTRQRKCPKCNCAFGANDFHRIYIT
ncbi:E3 ubiquitin-protein ligase BRE1B isoform X2 [Pseudochaenichthys georgianus]|uniref:E3 ubiquitin-protein ligase BRE1B isoform X2 n=1 Tax=Pseudochaenichthys georgianus TaxID=52239 RepID=UPI00146EA56A|nr:E3 ubiquitin-protein ligase BRE1B isoform X2 [Pseudochaenichthys georgianus]